MTVDLNDRVIVVTGAGGGIGRATSVELAAAGARLVLVDRDPALLAGTRDVLGDTPNISVHADVTVESDVEAYTVQAIDAFGRIDGFFNNAGIEGAVDPIASADADAFDRVMAVNVRGVFLGLRHVLPLMTARGSGSVVCTGSIGSVLGMPNTGGYNASKHAVLGLVRTAAAEVARQGVRVNAVMPGFIDTRMLLSLAEQLGPEGDSHASAEAMAMGGSPMGRLGSPTEVGRVVRFLLSDEASYVTGAGISVDGGITCTSYNGG